MRGYRNPLGALQPNRPDPEAVKRAGWQGQRILVVALDDDRLDGFQREFVKQIGEALYGGRSDSRAVQPGSISQGTGTQRRGRSASGSDRKEKYHG